MRQLTPLASIGDRARGMVVVRGPIPSYRPYGHGDADYLYSGMGWIGLGEMSPAEHTAATIAGATLSSAGAVASALAGAATAAGATTGLGAAIAASGIVPFIGPILAGAMVAITLILGRSCGQSCVITSDWANEAEEHLKTIIAAYFSLPAPRPISARNAALGMFDAVWDGLVQRCSQPGLATAGQNCIQDRQSGSCEWRQTTTSPLLAYPGEPQPGECWNWFSGYRDPIAMDPAVPDEQSASAQATTTSATSTPSGSSPSPSGGSGIVDGATPWYAPITNLVSGAGSGSGAGAGLDSKPTSLLPLALIGLGVAVLVFGGND